MRSVTITTCCIIFLMLFCLDCSRLNHNQKVEETDLTQTPETKKDLTNYDRFEEYYPPLNIEKVLTFEEQVSSAMVICDNRCYFREIQKGSDKTLIKAVDLHSKKVIWEAGNQDVEFPFFQDFFLMEDKLLCSSNNRNKYDPKSIIMALDIHDGSIRWRFQFDDSFLNLKLVRETLFLCSWQHIYAYEIQTGQLLWRKRIYDFFPNFSLKEDYYHFLNIISDQKKLFLSYSLENGMDSKHLSNYKQYFGCLALEPENGKVLWQFEKISNEYTDIDQSCFIMLEKYILLFGYVLIEAKNGNMVWQYTPDKSIDPYDHNSYFGYNPKAKILLYRYPYVLIGIDLISGLEKWRIENLDESSSCFIDFTHRSEYIFVMYAKTKETDERRDRIAFNRMDVYSFISGGLIKSYDISQTYWFDEIEMGMEFMHGCWYFIGHSSLEKWNEMSLFRFHMNDYIELLEPI